MKKYVILLLVFIMFGCTGYKDNQKAPIKQTTVAAVVDLTDATTLKIWPIGKPIIAIIKGEAADIIRENQLGLVCHPDSLEEIKSVFIEAIEMSDEKSKKYIKNSELLTNTIFKKEVIMDNLLELLKRG